jgi:hypothetical protein
MKLLGRETRVYREPGEGAINRTNDDRSATQSQEGFIGLVPLLLLGIGMLDFRIRKKLLILMSVQGRWIRGRRRAWKKRLLMGWESDVIVLT